MFTITVQSRSRYSRRDTVRYEKFTLLRLERNFHCNRKHNFDKLYLIFDLAKYHITPKVLNHLEKINIKQLKFLQDLLILSILVLVISYGKNGLFLMKIRVQNIINCINWCLQLSNEFSSKNY